MVELETFFQNVRVFNDESQSLGQRLKSLLEDVILRLPDEEQFHMRGQIGFNTREQAVEIWAKLGPKIGFAPDLRPYNRDGNCVYTIAETIENSMFLITIIVDNLELRSDDYIKGLIAHEFSELSYAWKTTQKEMPTLKKMKAKARQIKIEQITKQSSNIDSKEYAEHEQYVNDEARKLGFQEEIDKMEREAGN